MSYELLQVEWDGSNRNFAKQSKVTTGLASLGGSRAGFRCWQVGYMAVHSALVIPPSTNIPLEFDGELRLACVALQVRQHFQNPLSSGSYLNRRSA